MDKLTQLAILKHPHLANVYAIEALTKVVDRNRGDKGDMPVKGVDYLTSEEVEEIITEILSRIPPPENGYTPVRGVDYFDGEHGETPVKGIHYRDGIDGDHGKTPVKGKDYFTEKDVAAIAKAAAKLIKMPKVEDLHAEVDKRMQDTYAPIKDLQDLIEFLKRGGFRGGAGTPQSGTSGNQKYGEVVAGSGTAWNLAVIPIAGTVRLFANGQRLTQGVDYSITNASITTVSSWVAGTILADYSF